MKLRMVKLYPEQVARHWDLLCPLIESTLPPVTTPGNKRSIKILEGLLSGVLIMHQFYHQLEDSVKALAFIITIASNSVDGTGKDLFIYSVYGYEAVSLKDIFEALDLIKAYAKGEGCNAITALTDVPQLKDYIKRAGGSTEYTFIRLEV